MIEVKNLSYNNSNTNKILKNINLKIESGEFVCIVGENGSGKSTLVRCILKLNKATHGEVICNERIGYLPQMTDIQNNFPATIEEIVLSGTIPNNPKKLFYTKDDKQRAIDILKQLNLYEIKDSCFYELSGGQKQRVLIARALASTDKIILLDEPVNGLDPKIVVEIYELLYKLNKEKKLTVIMVSHDIDRAIKYSSRVIEIAHGEVIKDVEASKYKNASY